MAVASVSFPLRWTESIGLYLFYSFSFSTSSEIDLYKFTITDFFLKYPVTNISIHAHLLDFLRIKDLDAAYPVHRLPEIPQTRQHKLA